MPYAHVRMDTGTNELEKNRVLVLLVLTIWVRKSGFVERGGE